MFSFVRTAPGEWLRIHRFLMRLVLAGVNGFAWAMIFWFFVGTLGDSTVALARTVSLFALSQIVVALITPYAGLLVKCGIRRAMFYGVLFAAVGYASLGAAFDVSAMQVNPAVGFVCFALSLGVYRALYWMPYVVEVSEIGVAPRSAPGWWEAPLVMMPFVGGMYLAGHVGGEALFLYAAAGGLVVAALPLFRIAERRECYPWHHCGTFAELFSRKYRMLVGEAFLRGMESAALTVVWPITILLLTGWSYSLLGLTLALTAGIILCTRKGVRRALTALRIRESRGVHMAVAAAGWLGRLTVAYPVGVVIVDACQHSVTPQQGWYDAATREVAADGGYYLDHYTALKEVAHALGALTLCGIVMALCTVAFFSYVVLFTFAIVALASAANVWLGFEKVLRY